MTPTMNLVLVVNNKASVASRARLHAAGCPVVAGKEGANGVQYLREGDHGLSLQDVIDDLVEMEYPVKRCRCCK